MNSCNLFHRIIPILLIIIATPASAANTDGCMMRMPVATTSTSTSDAPVSLYTRLGGYDAIAAVVDDLVTRLMADPTLGRFWAHRGTDGVRREKQLVINFIVEKAGGPLHYGGRDMVPTHQGMKISETDWKIFMGYVDETLKKFKVPAEETTEVKNFVEGLKSTIVEINHV